MRNYQLCLSVSIFLAIFTLVIFPIFPIFWDISGKSLPIMKNAGIELHEIRCRSCCSIKVECRIFLKKYLSFICCDFASKKSFAFLAFFREIHLGIFTAEKAELFRSPVCKKMTAESVYGTDLIDWSVWCCFLDGFFWTDFIDPAKAVYDYLSSWENWMHKMQIKRRHGNFRVSYVYIHILYFIYFVPADWLPHHACVTASAPHRKLLLHFNQMGAFT